MLSKKCQYALHALTSLARGDGKSLTTAQIIRERNLPRKFLEGILCELKQAGIVNSKKGKLGGYRLARHPADISIRQVVEAMKGDPLFSCSHSEKGRLCKSCNISGKCFVNTVMHSIRDHAITWLSTHSIAHIALEEGESILVPTHQ